MVEKKRGNGLKKKTEEKKTKGVDREGSI